MASNKAVPLSDLSLLVLSRALASHHQQLALARSGAEVQQVKCCSTSLCGHLLLLLASMIGLLVGAGKEDAILLLQTTDAIR